MLQHNPYSIRRHRKTVIKNLGYRYHGKIMTDNVSKSMQNDPMTLSFLQKIGAVVEFLLYSVKHIKKSYNYIVDKDTDYIN